MTYEEEVIKQVISVTYQIRAVIEERLDGALSWRDLKTKDKGNMNGSDSDKIEILKVETKKLK